MGRDLFVCDTQVVCIGMDKIKKYYLTLDNINTQLTLGLNFGGN